MITRNYFISMAAVSNEGIEMHLCARTVKHKSFFPEPENVFSMASEQYSDYLMMHKMSGLQIKLVAFNRI